MVPHRLRQHGVPDFAWLFGIAILYYILLLALGIGLFGGPPPPLDVTFNNMLAHLLQGRFDVDQAVVGQEGFTRDGRVYAYWGVFPALLRLPLLFLPDWQSINVTAPSCLMAVAVAASAKLWSVRRVAQALPSIPPLAVKLVALAMLFSGAQISFLKPSVYQEVCLWAAAFGALFVAGATAMLVGGVSRGNLMVMALASQGALLTRVSVGVALVLAAVLLAVVLVARAKGQRRQTVVLLVAPAAVVAIGMAMVGGINYARWGDPLTFADYRFYNFNATFVDRLPRTERYGLFNLARLPFGLVYYFLPLWVVPAGDGTWWFAAMRDRLMDAVELPPASFLWTDSLLLFFGGFGIVRYLRGGERAWEARAIAIGLAAAPLLMLTAISMCFRYRLDFYPLIDFAALLGLMSVADGGWTARRRRIAVTALAVSVLGAHATLILYAIGPFGPAQHAVVDGDVIGFYARLMASAVR